MLYNIHVPVEPITLSLSDVGRVGTNSCLFLGRSSKLIVKLIFAQQRQRLIRIDTAAILSNTYCTKPGPRLDSVTHPSIHPLACVGALILFRNQSSPKALPKGFNCNYYGRIQVHPVPPDTTGHSVPLLPGPHVLLWLCPLEPLPVYGGNTILLLCADGPLIRTG